MKTEIIERDKKIQEREQTIKTLELGIKSLQDEIVALKTPAPTPKKPLNNRAKKEVVNILPQVEESPSVSAAPEKQPTDDF
jgi:predicted AAA+ superfamily ATPase